MHSTIKLYLSDLHISSGHGNPLHGKLLLLKVLQGILRYQGWSRIIHQPVTPGVLATIQPILRKWLGEWDFTMIWAASTLAFFAFLCCSEFTHPGTSFALGLTFQPTVCHFLLVWLARSRCLFSSRLVRRTFTVKVPSRAHACYCVLPFIGLHS